MSDTYPYEVTEAMPEVRWSLKPDGRVTLQQKYFKREGTRIWHEWRDVPVVTLAPQPLPQEGKA